MPSRSAAETQSAPSRGLLLGFHGSQSGSVPNLGITDAQGRTIISDHMWPVRDGSSSVSIAQVVANDVEAGLQPAWVMTVGNTTGQACTSQVVIV